MFRMESARIRSELPPMKLDRFQDQGGILWSMGRFDRSTKLRCVDLEMDLPFYDESEIAPVVPVVRDSSGLFHAYVMHVHLKVRPHSGVELTVKEINRKMFIIGNPRRVVAGVRKDCTKCRRIRLKTVELMMVAHSAKRSTIAPPFYAVQVDIAYGFIAVPWKKARNKVGLYALVIVCILSSATSILALEGISCKDVVAALE